MRHAGSMRRSRPLRRGVARKLGEWSGAWLTRSSGSLRRSANDARVREPRLGRGDSGARISDPSMGLVVALSGHRPELSVLRTLYRRRR